MTAEEKIVIKAKPKPRPQEEESVDQLADWFCQVFGLSGKADEPEAKMFRDIIVGSFSGSGITSKDLNEELDMPRSTVIYHLNRFIGSGLVVRKGRRYYLRSDDLESTIEELHADIEREFRRMMQFAQLLDEHVQGEIYGRRRKAGKEREERQ